MNVSFPLLALKVARIFAADRDIRYYLCGICFEIEPDAVTLVSTDGHRMGAFRVDGPHEVEGRKDVIVPNELIDIVLSIKPKPRIVPSIEPKALLHLGDDGMLDLSFEAVTVRGKPLDAKYPDWRRVMPEKPTCEVAYFNPDYLASFDKAARLVMGARAHASLTYNGTGAAPVGIGDKRFIGLVMPWRNNVAPDVPAWAIAPKAAAPEPALDPVPAAV